MWSAAKTGWRRSGASVDGHEAPAADQVAARSFPAHSLTRPSPAAARRPTPIARPRPARWQGRASAGGASPRTPGRNGRRRSGPAVTSASCVRLGRDHAVGDLAHAVEMQVGVGLGAEHHREVQDAGQKVGAHLVGIVGLDVEGGLGQGARGTRPPSRQGRRRQGRSGCQGAEAAPRPAGSGCGAAPRSIRGAARGRGARTVCPSGVRSVPGARAVEEARARRACSSAVHPGRDGGLRDPQPFGRAVEAARFGKVEEGVEKVDLHVALRLWQAPGVFHPGPPRIFGRKDA